MNEMPPPRSLSFFSGPSSVNFAPKGLTPILPLTSCLFPSRVEMSMTDEMRPPNLAENPPV